MNETFPLRGIGGIDGWGKWNFWPKLAMPFHTFEHHQIYRNIFMDTFTLQKFDTFSKNLIIFLILYHYFLFQIIKKQSKHFKHSRFSRFGNFCFLSQIKFWIHQMMFFSFKMSKFLLGIVNWSWIWKFCLLLDSLKVRRRELKKFGFIWSLSNQMLRNAKRWFEPSKVLKMVKTRKNSRLFSQD